MIFAPSMRKITFVGYSFRIMTCEKLLRHTQTLFSWMPRINSWTPSLPFACSLATSLIVGMGILVNEDAESVKWSFEKFKNKNPSVMFTRLVMADKDINEREMSNVVLPRAHLSTPYPTYV